MRAKQAMKSRVVHGSKHTQQWSQQQFGRLAAICLSLPCGRCNWTDFITQSGLAANTLALRFEIPAPRYATWKFPRFVMGFEIPAYRSPERGHRLLDANLVE